MMMNLQFCVGLYTSCTQMFDCFGHILCVCLMWERAWLACSCYRQFTVLGFRSSLKESFAVFFILHSKTNATDKTNASISAPFIVSPQILHKEKEIQEGDHSFYLKFIGTILLELLDL